MSSQPWHSTVDWWADPRLAYARGLSDGYARGWREATALADVEIVSALTHALGGPECPDRREAVRRHLRQLDQLAARRAADEGRAA